MSDTKLLQVKLPAVLLEALDAKRPPLSRRAWIIIHLCDLLGVDVDEVMS